MRKGSIKALKGFGERGGVTLLASVVVILNPTCDFLCLALR